MADALRGQGRRVRGLASGATELWADGVRPGHRLDALGEKALEAERPLHIALDDSDRTLCLELVRDLRESPVDFEALDQHLRCPACDRQLQSLD
jgi:hypothetical protein